MKFDWDTKTIIYIPGESVRFEVDSLGTSHMVNYDLGGKQGDLHENESLQFTFDREHHGQALAIAFAFSEPTGGEYRIRVIGGRGVEVARRFVKQSDRISVLAFGLEGDPDTDAD